MSDRVVLVPSDPAWPARFAQQRDSLLAILPATARIEHVGSTSVPGLVAKPIVDMLLGVERLLEVEAVLPRLEILGWDYLAEHESVFPERRFFARPSSRPRTHHLHAVELGSAFWRDHLAFRDHLRRHPEDARAYGSLKRRLARRHACDRVAYTDAKTEFIADVLSRSRRGAGSGPAG